MGMPAFLSHQADRTHRKTADVLPALNTMYICDGIADSDDSLIQKELCSCTVRDHSRRNPHPLHMRGQELPWPPQLKRKAFTQDIKAQRQVTTLPITS